MDRYVVGFLLQILFGCYHWKICCFLSYLTASSKMSDKIQRNVRKFDLFRVFKIVVNTNTSLIDSSGSSGVSSSGGESINMLLELICCLIHHFIFCVVNVILAWFCCLCQHVSSSGELFGINAQGMLRANCATGQCCFEGYGNFVRMLVRILGCHCMWP